MPMTDDDLKLLAFEAAPVGLVMTETRIIVACNRTFCALSQYPREQLLGRSFRMLYASRREFDAVRDIGLPALIADGRYSDQRILRRRDGSGVWCRFRAQTLTPDKPLRRMVLSYANLGAPPSHPTLTARERDVVMGLTRGQTSKQMAAELGLSPRSVEDVRSRLLKKCGVKTATELLSRFTNMEI